MMRDPQTLSVVLSSLLSIAGLWWLLFWLYRDYCVDRFRQDVFSLRDRLFDYAAAGALSFDHPSYGMLRSTMNGFIRFGHRISLLQFLLFAVFGDQENSMRSGQWFQDRWGSSTSDLAPEVKRELERLRGHLNVLLLKHVVLSSPLLVLSFIIPLAFILRLRYFSVALASPFRRPLDRMDSLAAAYGSCDAVPA